MRVQKVKLAALILIAAILPITASILSVTPRHETAAAQNPPVPQQDGFVPLSGADPNTAPGASLLERKLPEIKFDNVPFGDVIEFMRDVSGANIYVDWQGLAPAGGASTPATLRLRDVSFAVALQTTLGTIPGGASYRVNQEGVIEISTPARLEQFGLREKWVRRVTEELPQLAKKLPEARMSRVGIVDALDFLNDVTSVPVADLAKSLKVLGIDDKAAITLKLREISGAQMLDLMLAQLPSPKGMVVPIVVDHSLRAEIMSAPASQPAP